jgi:GT2 family glycosyltransferase
MRVSVIIVNYNGAHLLPDCLEGLEAQTRPADEVIVVDNHSTDDSISILKGQYPWVRVVRSGENLGFSGGNNLGIWESTGEVVVLLNNDTLPSPGFIESIVKPLERDEDISAVSGVLTFTSSPEIVATSGVEVFDNGLALDRDIGALWCGLPSEQPVFGPTGGAAAFRRAILSQTDLFPEPYFLYLEDVDLAWRLRLQGFRSVSRKSAWALHVYSASSVEGSALKDYYLARNRAWTLIRCWPGEIWRRNWLRVLVYELGAIAHALATFRSASIRGRIDGWTGVFRLRKVRRIIQRRRKIEMPELIYWIKAAPSVRNIFRLRRVVRNGSDQRERNTG